MRERGQGTHRDELDPVHSRMHEDAGGLLGGGVAVVSMSGDSALHGGTSTGGLVDPILETMERSVRRAKAGGRGRGGSRNGSRRRIGETKASENNSGNRIRPGSLQSATGQSKGARSRGGSAGDSRYDEEDLTGGGAMHGGVGMSVPGRSRIGEAIRSKGKRKTGFDDAAVVESGGAIRVRNWGDAAKKKKKARLAKQKEEDERLQRMRRKPTAAADRDRPWRVGGDDLPTRRKPRTRSRSASGVASSQAKPTAVSSRSENRSSPSKSKQGARRSGKHGGEEDTDQEKEAAARPGGHGGHPTPVVIPPSLPSDRAPRDTSARASGDASDSEHSLDEKTSWEAKATSSGAISKSSTSIGTSIPSGDGSLTQQEHFRQGKSQAGPSCSIGGDDRDKGVSGDGVLSEVP